MNYKQVEKGKLFYGQLVSVRRPDGWDASAKVHFFNDKGVFIGNRYQFHNWDDVYMWAGGPAYWERVFYKKRFERLRQYVYVAMCRLVTVLINITQRISR